MLSMTRKTRKWLQDDAGRLTKCISHLTIPPRREVSQLGFKPVAVQWMKAIIHDATSKSSLTTDVCRTAKPWRAWRFNGGILDRVSV
jgi:hypothetical protein